MTALKQHLLKSTMYLTRGHQPTAPTRLEDIPPTHQHLPTGAAEPFTPTNITPQTVLQLQGLIGNRATMQLMREQHEGDATVSAGVPSFIQSKLGGQAAEPHVQRKVFLQSGSGFRPYKVGKKTPKQIKDWAKDDVTRRFKNSSEAREYAGGLLDHMGYVARDQQWIRLDNKFIVIGEEHSAAKNAAPLIPAFGTSRYRYEGFSSDWRESNKTHDGTFKARSEAQEKKGLKKKGGDESEVGMHAAEDVLPKFARVIPDMAKVAADQVAGKSVDGVNPDRTWAEEYSLAKALTQGFLNALIYAQSYNFGFFKKHKSKILTSIAVMQQAEVDDKMPDFSTVPIRPHMTQMAAVFKKKAKAAVGLKKIKNFIPQLDTTDESRVSHTEGAKRLDYLRDYSMYKTILEAKSSDLLFIIGDAHRRKLMPLLGQAGIPAVFYPDLLK